MEHLIFDITSFDFGEILPVKYARTLFFKQKDVLFGEIDFDKKELHFFWDFLSSRINLKIDEQDEIDCFLVNETELFKATIYTFPDFAQKADVSCNVVLLLEEDENPEYEAVWSHVLALREKEKLNLMFIQNNPINLIEPKTTLIKI